MWTAASRHLCNMQHFVVMGVAGCGKSTVATLVAQYLSATFIEADALHSSANIAKMQNAEPLNDADRWPWLQRVANAMQASKTPVIASCSCLRRTYRDCLRLNAGASIGFIHLHADEKLIAERMSQRTDHFMPVDLLQSQLALLEPLQADEISVVIDSGHAVQRVVDDAILFVNRMRAQT